MKRTVKIGDQEIEMVATAATDIYFNLIFREDSIKIQLAKDVTEGDVANLMLKMGFVMAMQAKNDRKAMMNLSMENYLEWMDQFDHGDYVTAIRSIQLVYEGQKDGESKPKKTKDQ